MKKFQVKVLINVYFVHTMGAFGGHYVCNSNFHYFHTSAWLKSPPAPAYSAPPPPQGGRLGGGSAPERCERSERARARYLRPNGVFIYSFIYLFTKRMALVGFEEAIHTILILTLPLIITLINNFYKLIIIILFKKVTLSFT